MRSRWLFFSSLLLFQTARAADTFPPLSNAQLIKAFSRMTEFLDKAPEKPHQKIYLQIKNADAKSGFLHTARRTNLTSPQSEHFAAALWHRSSENFGEFFEAASAKSFYASQGRRYAEYFLRRYGEVVGDDLGLGFCESEACSPWSAKLTFARDLGLTFYPPAGPNVVRFLRVSLPNTLEPFREIWTDSLGYPWILLLQNVESEQETFVHPHELRHYFDFRHFPDPGQAMAWIESVEADLIPLTPTFIWRELEARIYQSAPKRIRTIPRRAQSVMAKAADEWKDEWRYLLRPIEVRAYQESAIFFKEQGETWEEVRDNHTWPSFFIDLSEVGVHLPPFHPAFFEAYLKRAYDTEQLDPLEVGTSCEQILAPHQALLSDGIQKSRPVTARQP